VSNGRGVTLNVVLSLSLLTCFWTTPGTPQRCGGDGTMRGGRRLATRGRKRGSPRGTEGAFHSPEKIGGEDTKTHSHVSECCILYWRVLSNKLGSFNHLLDLSVCTECLCWSICLPPLFPSHLSVSSTYRKRYPRLFNPPAPRGGVKVWVESTNTIR
jgi:hypothetical protein